MLLWFVYMPVRLIYSGRHFHEKHGSGAKAAGGSCPAQRWMQTSIVDGRVMRRRPGMKRTRRVSELFGG
jgi:hypothetical protein